MIRRLMRWAYADACLRSPFDEGWDAFRKGEPCRPRWFLVPSGKRSAKTYRAMFKAGYDTAGDVVEIRDIKGE